MPGREKNKKENEEGEEKGSIPSHGGGKAKVFKGSRMFFLCSYSIAAKCDRNV